MSTSVPSIQLSSGQCASVTDYILTSDNNETKCAICPINSVLNVSGCQQIGTDTIIPPVTYTLPVFVSGQPTVYNTYSGIPPSPLLCNSATDYLFAGGPNGPQCFTCPSSTIGTDGVNAVCKQNDGTYLANINMYPMNQIFKDSVSASTTNTSTTLQPVLTTTDTTASTPSPTDASTTLQPVLTTDTSTTTTAVTATDTAPQGPVSSSTPSPTDASTTLQPVLTTESSLLSPVPVPSPVPDSSLLPPVQSPSPVTATSSLQCAPAYQPYTGTDVPYEGTFCKFNPSSDLTTCPSDTLNASPFPDCLKTKGDVYDLNTSTPVQLVQASPQCVSNYSLYQGSDVPYTGTFCKFNPSPDVTTCPLNATNVFPLCLQTNGDVYDLNTGKPVQLIQVLTPSSDPIIIPNLSAVDVDTLTSNDDSSNYHTLYIVILVLVCIVVFLPGGRYLWENYGQYLWEKYVRT